LTKGPFLFQFSGFGSQTNSPFLESPLKNLIVFGVCFVFFEQKMDLKNFRKK
jgi:hypothetical protein